MDKHGSGKMILNQNEQGLYSNYEGLCESLFRNDVMESVKVTSECLYGEYACAGEEDRGRFDWFKERCSI